MKLYELWKSSHEAKPFSILVLFFFWFVLLSISLFLSLDSSFSLAYITPPSSLCHSDLWTSISNHLLPPAAKAITPFSWPLSVSLSLSLSLLTHTHTLVHLQLLVAMLSFTLLLGLFRWTPLWCWSSRSEHPPIDESISLTCRCQNITNLEANQLQSS